MERLGIEKNPLKQAGGAILEKFSRLKLDDAITGSSDFSRLLEMEGLAIGIAGKLGLWRTLKEIAHVDPRLSETDLDGLIQRAQQQLMDLERHRLEAALKAFAG